MPDRLTLDRDQLQKLLESAFVLQQHSSHGHLDEAGTIAIAADSLAEKPPASPAELRALIGELPRMATAGQIDLDEAFDLISLHLQQTTSADGVAVGLLEKGAVNYRAATGFSRSLFGMNVRCEATLFHPAIATTEVILSPETSADGRLDHLLCQMRGARSLVVAPILFNGSMAGALEVISEHGDAFSNAAVDCCKIAAEVAADCMINTGWEPGSAEPVPAEAEIAVVTGIAAGFDSSWPTSFVSGKWLNRIDTLFENLSRK